MEPHDLTETSRDALSRLLTLDRSEQSVWEAADLHAILCHQLDAEVEFDLTHFGGVAKETMASVAASGDATKPRTFGQLLTEAAPPLEMLDMIRRFAKRSRTQGLEGMPEEIATVLYYAAIAAARLRHRESISKLDDAALMDGIDWALQQSWVAEPLRDLFSETIEAIRSREPETDA